MHQGQNLVRGVASVLVAAGLEVLKVVVLGLMVVLGLVVVLGVVAMLEVVVMVVAVTGGDLTVTVGGPTVTVAMAVVVCVRNIVEMLSEEDVAVEVVVVLSGGGLGAGKACTPIVKTKYANVVNLKSSWHNIVSGGLAKHECRNLQGHVNRIWHQVIYHDWTSWDSEREKRN